MSSRRALSALAARLEATAVRTSPPQTRAAILALRIPRQNLPTLQARSRQFRTSAFFCSTLPSSSSSSSSSASSSSSTTSTPTPEAPTKIYNYPEITTLTTSPNPHTILIDVREPAELQNTGKIPTAINLPLTSSPDFMFLAPSEFEDRFGVARPGPDDEVVFYCKSGVRSRAAARLAVQAGFGGRVSEYPGSWLDWEKQGGKTEKV